MSEATFCSTFSGADDEIRTRDLNLGKVALYQLSYIRLFALLKLILFFQYKRATFLLHQFGADDEIRMQTRLCLSAFPTKQSLSGPRDLNLGPGLPGSYIRLSIFQMPFFKRAMQIYFNPEDKSKCLPLLFYLRITSI